ncbi:hypothetical protein, partial [Nocardioides sp.]|uniref:hypothetical protein n=1 Tax=Nocardioides sp. TaxID=35761 RepID=UPI001A2B6680
GRQHDLVVMSDRTGGGWSVDSRAGTISVGGASMPVTDIEAFDLAALRFDTLSFRGGPADEELSLGQGPRAGPGEARVDMGGGDDTLTIDSSLTGPYDGGPGSDTFVLTGYGGRWVAEQRAVIDLRSGLASVGGGAQAELVSFTNAGLEFFDRNLVRGGAEPSTIRVRGCHATVHGGGGDDLVVFQASDGCVGPPAQRSIRAYGEGGADELRGSSGDDVLVGGPGADVAKGARGRDRCSAETRTSC